MAIRATYIVEQYVLASIPSWMPAVWRSVYSHPQRSEHFLAARPFQKNIWLTLYGGIWWFNG